MRAILPLCVLLLLTALPAPAQEASGEPERAVFTMAIGDSLTLIDSLVRTDDRLVSRVTNLHRARFLIEADLQNDASVERLRMVIWPWDRTVEDEPAIDVVLRPVAGVLYEKRGDEMVALRRIEPGTFPYASPSLAFAEQEILHALGKAEGADSVTIPMWTPYGGDGKGRTWTDTVVFVEPDSVRITGWEDLVSTYRVDAAGRIVSGTIEPAGYEIERTDLPSE